MKLIRGLVKQTRQYWQDGSRDAKVIAATCSDLGLGPNDLRMIDDYPKDVTERMARMADVFNTTPDDLLVEGWRNREMIHACAYCSHRIHCAEILYADRAPTTVECEFCPNASHYKELAEKPL